mgnify:CR=1 FL=1
MQNRKFLTHHEINLLLQSVKQKSCSSRDVCMILLAYFHGLRVSELLSLQLSDLELTTEKNIYSTDKKWIQYSPSTSKGRGDCNNKLAE